VTSFGNKKYRKNSLRRGAYSRQGMLNRVFTCKNTLLQTAFSAILPTGNCAVVFLPVQHLKVYEILDHKKFYLFCFRIHLMLDWMHLRMKVSPGSPSWKTNW